METIEYLDLRGRSPFGEWFAKLEAKAAAKVVSALARLVEGNVSNVKSVGGGVAEVRIDYGPGYRIYFGREGDKIVVLLGGGTKQRQRRDIENARSRWHDYRQKRTGRTCH